VEGRLIDNVGWLEVTAEVKPTFKFKMEITKTQIKELMTKAFKFGQQKYEANGFAIKLWIEGEIEKIWTSKK